MKVKSSEANTILTAIVIAHLKMKITITMKNIFIVILLITACSCQNTKTDLQGIWTCEYLMEVNFNQQFKRDSVTEYDAIEPVIDKLIDTTYSPAMIVFDFKNDTDVNYLFYIPTKGNLTQKDDSLFITSSESIISPDTLNYKGIIKKERLYLERQKGRTKLIYCLKKAEPGTSAEIKQSDLIGSFWSTSELDSITTKYHIIDSTFVIINNHFGIHEGRWGYRFFNGIGCLYIFDMDYSVTSMYYIFDDNGTVERISDSYDLQKTISKSGHLKRSELLSNEEYQEKKTNIIGYWSSDDFKTISRNFDDSIYYKDLKFGLEFKQNTFELTFSGIKKSTNEEFFTNRNGKWNLSKTGEYITLAFTVIGRKGREYEVTNLIKFKSVTEDKLEIGIKDISLNERDIWLRDESMNLTRKNGL